MFQEAEDKERLEDEAMKWGRKESLKSREGETRVVRKFLLWPRHLGSDEWRWLCYADIVEKIVAHDVGGSMEWGNYAWKWTETAFHKPVPDRIKLLREDP